MIVVGTTLCAFVMDDPDTWGAWLNNAQAMRDHAIATNPDHIPHFFVAIETDARGLDPFEPLLARLAEIGGDYWTFQLDDGRTEVTTANRLRHIAMGQNLTVDFATAVGATHLLFMAADTEPPVDAIPKLLELNHPLCGGHVPTYGLRGPTVTRFIDPHAPAQPRYPAEWDVQEHMATAAFIFIARELFKPIKWRWDAEAGMSDDPCYHHDAIAYHGTPTYVRHDVVGRHFPECIGPVETRGHDMTVAR